MSDRVKSILHLLIAAALGAAVAMYANWRWARHKPGGEINVQVDSTVTQIDTATAVAPEPVDERIHDTIYIPVPIPAQIVPASEESVSETQGSVPEAEDSVIYLPVVLEQKVYEDPDSTYRAVVSGPAIDKYGPKLDTISVYSKKVIVYQTKTVYSEPSRWSVGIQAGYGASKDGLTPYIGFGVQYSLWAPKRRRAPP